jgi:heterodisulfide reductase subunit C
MATKPTFSQEVSNLLYATKGSPVHLCMQCATCSSTCPAAMFMDHSPRAIIAMIAANLKDEVLASNSFWYCASCYECTVRCPRGIHVADMMYGLKRYSMWKNRYPQGLLGPDFSRQFVKIIMRTGKSYEPALAPVFLFKYGWRGFLHDARMALRLLLKGRMPLLPSRIKRVKPFRRMLGRIIPLGGLA